jgi:hypothetical protein
VVEGNFLSACDARRILLACDFSALRSIHPNGMTSSCDRLFSFFLELNDKGQAMRRMDNAFDSPQTANRQNEKTR